MLHYDSRHYSKNIFNRIKALTNTSDYPGYFNSFFWRRKNAYKAASYLCEEIDEILKEAHDQNMIAGYRGYVLDTEKQTVVIKTPLYLEEQPLSVFLAEYLAAISPEYADPNVLCIDIQPVRYGMAEKSDADVLDDLTLILPRSTVLRELQAKTMVDILDIVHSYGVYEATYETQDREEEAE